MGDPMRCAGESRQHRWSDPSVRSRKERKRIETARLASLTKMQRYS
jgi:hypothetical protein